MPKSNTLANPADTSAESGDSSVLAVNRKKAASLLGISERLLWSWTNMKRIPHVRIGARVLYPVQLLREWLQKNAKSVTE